MGISISLVEIAILIAPFLFLLWCYPKIYEQETAIMNRMVTKGCDVMRCYFAKTAGVGALAFGAGVLLCLVLPTGALVFIESALVICAGAALFIK